MDIAGLPKGLWPILVQKWREGKKIEAREIDEALNWEDDDVPAYIKPFLRALINGEVKLKRGTKSEWPERVWQNMIREVEFYRREIEHYKDHNECNHLAEYPALAEHVEGIANMHGSALTLATDTVAAEYGVSYAALEQRRKRLMAALQAKRTAADKN